MASIKTEAPTTAGKPTPPKDLINLRNQKNGEVYRFSCRTCIDGHRAPLCDPKKHRGKIMYRRPNPGRPARQCGHPKSVQCDCLAKRTLCCYLSSEEWDQVQEGKIITVAMFDSTEDLEASQGKIGTNASSPGSTGSPVRVPQNTPFVAPSPSTATFQMFGVGGPQGNHEPAVDPFAWNGVAQQIMSHQQSPVDGPSPTSMQNMHTFQAVPPPGADALRSSVPTQSQFGQFQVTLPPVLTPGSTTSGPYGAYTTRTPSGSINYPTPDPSTPIDPHMVALQRQMSSNLELNHMEPVMQHHHTNDMTPRMPPMDHAAFSPPIMTPESMHIEMSMPGMDQTVAAPAMRPSQSCCSEKSKSPAPQMQIFDSYMYPGSAPSSQFPCPSCASTLCTCANCPSTMQSFEFGGAWAQACGRTGHLESPFPNAFSFPSAEVPPSSHIPPETPAPQVAQTPGSCCSSRTSVHQPVDSFTPLPPIMAHDDWPAQYSEQYAPVTSSMDQQNLHPSLLHDDQMMWQ
ncbi:hypothetical protein KVT40_003959 [Elsinoe batatas]|uniref:Copper-fist domain-containing protein n=1 Tax=Elsinoe batatas TaxID=2601811 RepID=A0A8K0L5K0_9PEZI|nr:hypothetical protein KVT40_003959 [Elsinoe batatas]